MNYILHCRKAKQSTCSEPWNGLLPGMVVKDGVQSRLPLLSYTEIVSAKAANGLLHKLVLSVVAGIAMPGWSTARTGGCRGTAMAHMTPTRYRLHKTNNMYRGNTGDIRAQARSEQHCMSAVAKHSKQRCRCPSTLCKLVPHNNVASIFTYGTMHVQVACLDAQNELQSSYSKGIHPSSDGG